jgi:hypothetical protein
MFLLNVRVIEATAGFLAVRHAVNIALDAGVGEKPVVLLLVILVGALLEPLHRPLRLLVMFRAQRTKATISEMRVRALAQAVKRKTCRP